MAVPSDPVSRDPDAAEAQVRRRDFFISYTGADLAWAEWIAWQLEEAGWTTILQAWDFAVGQNFILRMTTPYNRTSESSQSILLRISSRRIAGTSGARL
jgi:hypothetical protein